MNPEPPTEEQPTPDVELIPPGGLGAVTPPVSASSTVDPVRLAPLRPPWLPEEQWSRKKAAPPLLGKTPTRGAQIVLAPQDTITRFTGPVVSGEKGGVAIGSAILTLPLRVDYTMGDFTVPIQFEPVSMVLWMVKMTYQVFNGMDGATPRSAAVSLGSSPNGGEIIPQDGFDVLHTLTTQTAVGTLPFAADPNPFLGYITVRQFNATQGQGIVLIGYARA